MKKFKFNLEKVLALKKHNEELAKIEYAKVLQKKVLLEQEIDNCNINIGKTESLTASYGEKENLNTDYRVLMNNDSYILSLRKKIHQNLLSIEEMQPELDKLELKLRESIRERKSLDKLREKAFLLYTEECEKEETELIDEVSSNMFLREMGVKDA